jgi:hypothetical protein
MTEQTGVRELVQKGEESVAAATGMPVDTRGAL